ncbi:substrate-binding periplasmic protein [Moraxella oblonga]|uniref:substrate-binding periplasmic protein n=1 Tax=Moraxella oblonga TaxID=200413 RepID=UPI000829BD69|nr:transporter substrate-binding domain-containing protein [Moraxella oblonga]
MHKYVLPLIFGLLCVACGNNNEQATTTQQTQTLPTYRVATLFAYPPFAQIDNKGNVEGFDIDVINYIAKTKGFEVVYQPQGIWEGILEGLDEGRHDLVAAGVFVTPERQVKYDFSDVYMTTGWMLALKDQSSLGKANFQNFDDALQNSNTFVTEFNAPVHAQMMKLVTGRTGVNVVDAKTPYQQLTTVIQGNAQAAYDSQKVFEYYIHKFSNDPNTKMYGIVNPHVPVNHYAFATKKGNRELVQKLNEGLKEIQDNGKFQELQQKWFGATS